MVGVLGTRTTAANPVRVRGRASANTRCCWACSSMSTPLRLRLPLALVGEYVCGCGSSLLGRLPDKFQNPLEAPTHLVALLRAASKARLQIRLRDVQQQAGILKGLRLQAELRDIQCASGPNAHEHMPSCANICHFKLCKHNIYSRANTNGC